MSRFIINYQVRMLFAGSRVRFASASDRACYPMRPRPVIRPLIKNSRIPNHIWNLSGRRKFLAQTGVRWVTFPRQMQFWQSWQEHDEKSLLLRFVLSSSRALSGIPRPLFEVPALVADAMKARKLKCRTVRVAASFAGLLRRTMETKLARSALIGQPFITTKTHAGPDVRISACGA